MEQLNAERGRYVVARWNDGARDYLVAGNIVGRRGDRPVLASLGSGYVAVPRSANFSRPQRPTAVPVALVGIDALDEVKLDPRVTIRAPKEAAR